MQDAQKCFKLHSEYAPTGDQPQAIARLVEGFKEGNQAQTLLGGYGVRQDLHHGQCHPGFEQVDPDHCTQ